MYFINKFKTHQSHFPLPIFCQIMLAKVTSKYIYVHFPLHSLFLFLFFLLPHNDEHWFDFCVNNMHQWIDVLILRRAWIISIYYCHNKFSSITQSKSDHMATQCTSSPSDMGWGSKVTTCSQGHANDKNERSWDENFPA